MNDFANGLTTAVDLIFGFDADLRGIVSLSLTVSLAASILAFAVGAPLGTALAVYRFPGRSVLVVIVNALLGLPPVVVGLVVYLLLSRSGPFGSFSLLFTPTAMVIAQCALGTPIVIALVHRMSVDLWADYGDALLVDGSTKLKYPWLHAHHDDGDRIGNEQRQPQLRARARDDLDRPVNDGERR
jgi:tungstate transport system permease protein